MRAGTFWSGLTTLVILAVPILAGAGLLAFDAVYQSDNYVALMGYGLLALGALLGYRAIKVKAGPAGLEVEARSTADLEREIRSRPGAAERIDAHAEAMRGTRGSESVMVGWSGDLSDGLYSNDNGPRTRLNDGARDPCCGAWSKANGPGTDGDSWDRLVFYVDGRPVVGENLPDVLYCPWCGEDKFYAPV